MSPFVSALCAAVLLSSVASTVSAGTVTSPVVYSTGVSVEYSAVASPGGGVIGKFSAVGKTISATPSGGSAQPFGTAGKGQFALTAYFDLVSGALLDSGHSLTVTKKVVSGFETLYSATRIYS